MPPLPARELEAWPRSAVASQSWSACRKASWWPGRKARAQQGALHPRDQLEGWLGCGAPADAVVLLTTTHSAGPQVQVEHWTHPHSPEGPNHRRGAGVGAGVWWGTEEREAKSAQRAGGVLKGGGRGPKEQRQPSEKCLVSWTEWRCAGQHGGPVWREEPGLQCGPESSGEPWEVFELGCDMVRYEF